MKTNKQKGFIGVFVAVMVMILAMGLLFRSNEADIKRLEKSDKCFEKLLVKNYDINYETDKINSFMEECMSLKD